MVNQRGGYLIVLGNNLPLAEVKDGTVRDAPDGSFVDLDYVRFVTTDRDRLFFQAMLDGDLSGMRQNLDATTINKYKTINLYWPNGLDDVNGKNVRALPFCLEICAMNAYYPIENIDFAKNLEILGFLLDNGADPLSDEIWDSETDSSAFQRIFLELENYRSQSREEREYRKYLRSIARLFIDKKPELKETISLESLRNANSQSNNASNFTTINSTPPTNRIRVMCNSDGSENYQDFIGNNLDYRLVRISRNTANNNRRNRSNNSSNDDNSSNNSNNNINENTYNSSLLTPDNWHIETLAPEKCGKYIGSRNYKWFLDNYINIISETDRQYVRMLFMARSALAGYGEKLKTWFNVISHYDARAWLADKFPDDIPPELKVFFHLKQQYDIFLKIKRKYKSRFHSIDDAPLEAINELKSRGVIRFSNQYLNQMIDKTIEYIWSKPAYQHFDPRIKITILGNNLPLVEVKDGTIRTSSTGEELDLSRVRFTTSDRDRSTLQGMVEGNLEKVKKNLDVETINKYKTINYYHPDWNLKSTNSRILPFMIDVCCANMAFRQLTPRIMKQNQEIVRYLLEKGADPLNPNEWDNDFQESSTFERVCSEYQIYIEDGDDQCTFLQELIKTFIRVKPELLSQTYLTDDVRRSYQTISKKWKKIIDRRDLNAGKSPHNFVILSDADGRDTSEQACQTQLCRIIGDFDPLDREISRVFLNLTPSNVDQIYPKFSTTFLEKAIEYRDINSVKKLLNLGADPGRIGIDGKSMLQLASDSKSGAIWNLIKASNDKKTQNSRKNNNSTNKNTNNSNSGICYNPSPISLEPYASDDIDLISIKFPNKTSGWGKRGECILREELSMYLRQDMSNNRNSTSPAGSLMANWVGDEIENTGLGGSAGGMLYFRLPTTNSYITWKSLANLLRDKTTNIWYAHPLGQERIGNLWSIYGASQNHGQKPGFTVFKLSNNTVPLTPDDDEYILKKEDWFTPLKSMFKYNEDIDKFINKNISILIKNQAGGKKTSQGIKIRLEKNRKKQSIQSALNSAKKVSKSKGSKRK